MVDYTVI